MAYFFLLHLGGALALLLWALHMVSTGIDRGWRPEIVAALRWSANPIKSAALGTGLAVALQSATATGMLAASFAAKGTLAVASGLGVMLGADLGSSLVVYLLSLNFQYAAPALLIIGALMFFRSNTRKLRQSGRTLVGIALIFISLGLLGEATAPLRDSPLIPVAAEYLRNDVVTAMVAGAAIAWLLHSSVAAIILLITLATHGLVSLDAAAALLLGANVGGAFIPFVLTRAGAEASRRIMTGNLILRAGASILALVLLKTTGGVAYLPGASDAARIVNLHLLFNLALVIVGLPLIGPVLSLARRFDRKASPVESEERTLGLPPSCLDPKSVNEPAMALANTTRELIRMAEIISRMFEPVMEIYSTGDEEKIRQAKLMEAAINRAQTDIKLYLARVEFTADEQERRGQDLAAIAVNLEHVGDAITKTLLRLAMIRAEQHLAFSPTGWRELSELHQRVVTSMRLAQNVLATRDVVQARQLVEKKSEVRSAVDESMRQHMARLKGGVSASAATSNIHLETIRALKTINSLLATIGYHVLEETGEVLDSRLKPAS